MQKCCLLLITRQDIINLDLRIIYMDLFRSSGGKFQLINSNTGANTLCCSFSVLPTPPPPPPKNWGCEANKGLANYSMAVFVHGMELIIQKGLGYEEGMEKRSAFLDANSLHCFCFQWSSVQMVRRKDSLFPETDGLCQDLWPWCHWLCTLQLA